MQERGSLLDANATKGLVKNEALQRSRGLLLCAQEQYEAATSSSKSYHVELSMLQGLRTIQDSTPPYSYVLHPRLCSSACCSSLTGSSTMPAGLRNDIGLLNVYPRLHSLSEETNVFDLRPAQVGDDEHRPTHYLPPSSSATNAQAANSAGDKSTSTWEDDNQISQASLDQLLGPEAFSAFLDRRSTFTARTIQLNLDRMRQWSALGKPFLMKQVRRLNNNVRPVYRMPAKAVRPPCRRLVLHRQNTFHRF